jgi:hypothetical protein
VAKKGLEANASKPTGMPCSFSNVTVDSLPGLPETYDHVIKAPEPCQRPWIVPGPSTLTGSGSRPVAVCFGLGVAVREQRRYPRVQATREPAALLQRVAELVCLAGFELGEPVRL